MTYFNYWKLRLNTYGLRRTHYASILVFAFCLYIPGAIRAARTAPAELFKSPVKLQEIHVSGTVTDAGGETLPGVSVKVKDTHISASTDAAGKFNISVPDQNAILVFTYIGFNTQELKVGQKTLLNIRLSPSNNNLTEVVVTALNIPREKKALGYAVQDIGGQALATRPTNALSSISGKIAGLQVISSGGNMGGSTRVTLRGITSLYGSNQPLYVIDGTPIDNTDLNTSPTQNGSAGKDIGNMIQDLNPDDIENISVLKGPSASALYGTRSANGVILITTKKGKTGDRTDLSFTTGVELEKIVRLPKRQKLYGGGYSNEFQKANINGTEYNIVDYAADESWGPRLDGTPVLHWYNLDPEYPADYLNPQPWIYPKNDVTSFFETGISNTNNLSISGGSEKTTYRLSYTNKNVSGTVPNSSLNRNTISASGSSRFGKLNASSSINYVKNKTTGRPWTGASNRNIMLEAFQWGQVQVDYDRLKEYKRPDGTPRAWNRTGYLNTPAAEATRFIDNPYWSAYESYLKENRDRVFGNIGLELDATDWLKLRGKLNADIYHYDFQDRIAVYSRSQSNYEEYFNNFSELNYEFLALAKKNVNDFSINAIAGGNIMNKRGRISDVITQGGLIVPNYYNLRNAPSVATNSNEFHRKMYSLFGSVSVGWRNMLYLEGTVRNDWSSTLPESDFSFIYPSVTGSFVFSELSALKQWTWLDFAKLRLGWADAGNDTEPYRLAKVYEPGQAFGGSPVYSLPSTLNNANLQPELTRSLEAGLNIQALQRRVSIDVTVYDNKSRNQTIPIPLSPAFGYDSKYLNAGLITNKGIEVTLGASPVRNNNFEWNSTLNWSKNRNKVENLYEDVNTLELSNTLVTLVAKEGQSYGQIMGYDFVYAPDGQRLVQADGTYARTEQLVPLGSVLPDYLFGFQNSFRYKNFNLGFLVDGRVGGKFFSQTYKVGMYSGVLERTAANNVREDGIIVDGVKGNVQFNADGTYTVSNTSPNDTRISALNWARNEYNGPTTFSVFDATFVKLREVTLGYNFNLKNAPVRQVNLSLYGRNLWNIYTKSKYIDPEITNSGGNVQGIEGGNLPVPATFGLNLNFKF
ncbi:SusC/RagA family TonB-linked outer membrane protein [Pararcticibacter amylolyticus]|uniref:SusC/RagA family TonB-linked outer membrane protein n=1 Tax=Pararcticibacter amylolyticus TaxID=2173175 RepID=A0A2U2PL41_9SPHI|nr:SusC/RagA family TonB-linked outer membrane protein [Pararcticibacter amylolyticus]PWG81994.1 SusC/RagA family TonB-linked outer membrane protein [Pararcticibacter amylolyticus]